MKKQRLLTMILVSVSVVCVFGLIQLTTVQAALGDCTSKCTGSCFGNPNCACSVNFGPPKCGDPPIMCAIGQCCWDHGNGSECKGVGTCADYEEYCTTQ